MTREAPAKARRAGSGYHLRGVQGALINRLGQRIVAGTYASDTALPAEAVLMAEFGASRTSLREAIKVLSAKGLLESRQRIGTVVRPRRLWNVFDTDVITWHHLEGKSDKIFKDLVELRQLIEPGAARLAASRATLADLERIERAAKAMAASVGDPAKYCEADVEFHFAVVAASDNLLFTSFANVVGDFLRLSFEVQQNALNDSDNRIEDDAAHHMRVYQAICDGDGEAAAQAMARVVMEGKRSLVRAMAAQK